MDHEQNMHLALALARDAGENGDVPVGCVIADRDGNVIGRGRNRREEGRDATAHAEIEAIRDACRARGSWRLDDCVLYVTCGSVLDLFSENFHHRPSVYAGVCAEESRALLQRFFLYRREEEA